MKRFWWIISGLSILAITGTMATLHIEDIIRLLPKNTKRHYGKRKLWQINTIVVHHSAIDGFNAFDYARWHIKRGWPGIGYHFVIDRDGKVEQTNELTTLSYHVKGYNTQSIGISMSGNLSKHPATKAQMDALIKLIKKLKKDFNTPLLVKGHGELTRTECPGKLTNMKVIRSLT
jgi:N-acetyl-anhydromuramyl-L-alanine amidase AmpD